MKTSIPWLWALGTVVVLNIIASLFMSPSIRQFRLPLMLAAYVIGIVLSFKLGVWRALALWCCIGLVSGMLYWCYELWSARRSKEPDTKTPSPVTVIHGLFAWPIMLPEVIEYLWAEVFPTKKSTDNKPAA